MSKRVKSLDEIRESRILFDKNPPAFGYILITVVTVFLIVAVVWSIKTPKVYTIQAQGRVMCQRIRHMDILMSRCYMNCTQQAEQ